MAVRLTVKQRSEPGGAARGQEVILHEEPITIGRDSTCHVVLSQPGVSRSHARITRDGTLYFVEDLGSAYGTSVNGRALPRGEKRLLRNGDTIAIAQFDLVFDRLSDLAFATDVRTSFMARQAVKQVLGELSADAAPHLRVMNGLREGERIKIPEAREIIIGREDGVDVLLEDDLVSRRHAKVRHDWSGTHLEDLGSRNGVCVNQTWITRKTLADRDEIEIGSVRLLYVDPTAVREASLVVAEEQHPGNVGDASSLDGIPANAPAAPPPARAAPASAASSAAPHPGSEDLAAASTSDEALPEKSRSPGAPSSPDALPVDEKSASRNLESKRYILPAVVGFLALVALVFVVLVLAGA
jgi:pSer/pThr/pTyr-binding forkhead associated (FHA) protein